MKQYVVGAIVIVTGAFLIVGALTGNLAPMIAALFDTGDLTSTSGTGAPVAGGSTIPGLPAGTSITKGPGVDYTLHTPGKPDQIINKLP